MIHAEAGPPMRYGPKERVVHGRDAAFTVGRSQGTLQEQAPCFCRESRGSMRSSIRRSSSGSGLRYSGHFDIYVLANIAVAPAACRVARLCDLCSSLFRGICC